MAVTVAGRSQTLLEYLKTEGLLQEALRGRMAISPEVPAYQSLLFAAFPFYGMMPNEFAAHSERLRKEFVKALGTIMTGMTEGEELSPGELAEIEEQPREYNEVWQSSEGGGELTRRLGALACKRILGKAEPSSNFTVNLKVWSALTSEANNTFRNTIGLGKRYELIG